MQTQAFFCSDAMQHSVWKMIVPAAVWGVPYTAFFLIWTWLGKDVKAEIAIRHVFIINPHFKSYVSGYGTVLGSSHISF